VLFSPSFVNEAGWRAGMPARKGLRVFVSHGRRDDILPFDGGHEIPIEVVTALNRFLAEE